MVSSGGVIRDLTSILDSSTALQSNGQCCLPIVFILHSGFKTNYGTLIQSSAFVASMPLNKVVRLRVPLVTARLTPDSDPGVHGSIMPNNFDSSNE